MVEKMSLASSPYDPDVDEFIKSGLTPIESETVKPFRVKNLLFKWNVKFLM